MVRNRVVSHKVVPDSDLSGRHLPTPEKKKKKVRYSAYRSKRENGFLRSPIVLRSCGKATCNDKNISGDDNRHNEGDDFTPDSPLPC